MKVLLDTCVWGGAAHDLTAAGHEVEWCGEWERDPGDEEILARANAAGQVLVTLDKDFGELAVMRGVPHCGIIRLVGLAAREQAAACAEALTSHGEELRSGAIVTIELRRVRVRPPSK